MQARLRAIHDTPPVPHAMFMVHARVPAEQRARLQALMVGWRDDEAGRSLLKSLGFPGFVVPRLAEYDVLRHYDPQAIAAVTDRQLGPTLRLGVFPFLTPRQLADLFASSLPRLGSAVGRPVQLRSATSFGSFVEALSQRAYDIVVIQPFDYALAVQYGYRPLASMQTQVQGSFFVPAASPARQITDFRGKVIAMPPKEAAQSRLGLRALREAGLTPGTDVTIDHRRAHDSCLRQVQLGQADACVTAPFLLKMVSPTLSAGLRAVGQTDVAPGIVFMAHERVPEPTRRRLAAELIGWKDHEDGRRILRAVGLGDLGPVDVPAYERLQKKYGGS